MLKEAKTFDRLSVFSFLWAAQAMIHQEFFFRDWFVEREPLGWILTFIVIAVLIRPTLTWLFLVMVSTSFIYRVVRMPDVVNHIFTEAFLNLTILLVLGSMLLEQRQSRAAENKAWRDELFDRFAPIWRGMLIVLYVFAFVAKLNFDFFNPEVSCAAVMYRDLTAMLPFLPTANWAELTSVWGTVLIEGALPLLFAFRRTRWYGVVIGLPFHFVLALVGHRTFSALAFSVYFIFVSDDFTNAVNDWWQRLSARFGETVLRRRLFIFKLVGVLSAVTLIFIEFLANTSEVIPYFFRFSRLLIWIGWSTGLMLAYGAVFYKTGPRSSLFASQPFPRFSFLWIMPLLVFVNGMSQYLGLKTGLSYTMYSNLRTEEGRNNHLFMPSWLKIADYQEDVVDIVESDNQKFRRYLDRNQKITYFEFKRLANMTAEDFQVTYRRGDQLKHLSRHSDALDDPEIAQKTSVLLAKFLRFRPISKGACMECSH